jgi:hypothetical protein
VFTLHIAFRKFEWQLLEDRSLRNLIAHLVTAVAFLAAMFVMVEIVRKYPVVPLVTLRPSRLGFTSPRRGGLRVCAFCKGSTVVSEQPRSSCVILSEVT